MCLRIWSDCGTVTAIEKHSNAPNYVKYSTPGTFIYLAMQESSSKYFAKEGSHVILGLPQEQGEIPMCIWLNLLWKKCHLFNFAPLSEESAKANRGRRAGQDCPGLGRAPEARIWKWVLMLLCLGIKIVFIYLIMYEMGCFMCLTCRPPPLRRPRESGLGPWWALALRESALCRFATSEIPGGDESAQNRSKLFEKFTY